MKQLFTLFLILSAHIAGYCQQVYVPYRVGNKFGLSDDTGKITLQPQFDILEPAPQDKPYFIAYNLKDTVTLSGLIYNNKIIVSNQQYNGYYFNNDLFVASVYKMDHSKGYNDLSGLSHLYNIDGKKITNEDFKYVSILSELNKDENAMDEVLVNVIDLNNKNSVFVYNKKSKSIVKYYITKAGYLNVTGNDAFYDPDQKIIITYKEAGGKYKKITFNDIDRKIKLISTEDIVDDQEVVDGVDVYDDAIAPVEDEYYYVEPKSLLTGDSISFKIRSVQTRYINYYEKKQIEKIFIFDEMLNKKENYIISRNGKVGLMRTSDKYQVIPAKYDEILNAQFPSKTHGYIVKNNGMYGLFIYDFSNYAQPKNIIIEPVFNKLPLLASLNYIKKGFTLIKLFDEDGKFFCYANKDGKLFYSKE